MRLQHTFAAAGTQAMEIGGNMPGDVCTLPEDRNKQRSHKYEYEDEQDYF